MYSKDSSPFGLPQVGSHVYVALRARHGAPKMLRERARAERPYTTASNSVKVESKCIFAFSDRQSRSLTRGTGGFRGLCRASTISSRIQVMPAQSSAKASPAPQDMSVILVTGSYDHEIRFWEAWSGICSRTIARSGETGVRVCSSPCLLPGGRAVLFASRHSNRSLRQSRRSK